MAHGSDFFAMGAELRRQLRDPRVVAEVPSLDEDVRHRRGRALADRVAIKRRLRCYLSLAFRVGDARHCVGHRLTMAVYGDLQAPLGPGLDKIVYGRM